MSAPDKGTKKPSFDEKPPLSADAVEQNIFERQLFDGPNYNGSFNEKVAPLSPTTASTVEDVVRQQNLGRKPSPEHDLPFDFNRFLEQMKHKSAQPTAHFVYRFQKEFEKKPWTINEQTKIVHDFLDFISNQMRECELWRNASEQEFENAREGMEKLVMNRLYTLTFTPAIKGAVTTDDRERDEILHQKIQIFRWINEKHLDIPESKHNDSFLSFAKTELLKINNFKAPRDKLICILNCCKVIFGLIRQVDGEEGADKFLPILIFVVLRANPDHLVSNVQYISRFRNQEKLQSESGYYLSSLMGAISFIENMDVSSLSITQEEFDKNIEITVKELEQEIPKPKENDTIISYANVLPPSKAPQPVRPPIINPAQARALFENGKILAQNRIQRPLINIFGRLIAEMANDPNEPPTPEASNEFSDMQEEAAHITAQEYESSFETLRAMFPNYDPDVYESVLQATDGGLARAIDALLEMSGSINDLGGGLEVEGGNQTASPTIVTGEAPQKEVSAV